MVEDEDFGGKENKLARDLEVMVEVKFEEVIET